MYQILVQLRCAASAYVLIVLVGYWHHHFVRLRGSIFRECRRVSARQPNLE